MSLTIYGETETSKKALFLTLKECFQKEEDEWVQGCYYDDFYTLGEKQYLENMLCLLSSEDSIVPGSVAASLCEHIDEKNYQTIRESVKKLFLRKIINYLLII